MFQRKYFLVLQQFLQCIQILIRMFQFPGEPVADRDQIFERQRLLSFHKQPKYQFLDKKSAEHRHLSLGKDSFIVHRPAKIRVQPVHHQLFFLHLPFRESLLKRKQQLPVRGFLRTGMIQIGKRLSEKFARFQHRYNMPSFRDPQFERIRKYLENDEL